MSYQAGEIRLTELLNKQIASLYMSEQCSDITLYVEGQKIPAHRSIIGARCEYLNTYFSNGLNETNQTKFELNVPFDAFQVLLKYFYTGQMSLSKIKNIETLIQILNLVEEYCLFYLKTHFENYFKQIITVENTCRLLAVAKTYELKELEIKSLNIIDTNADKILACESFKKIRKDLLEEILTRNTFNASSELLKFRAIAEWSKHANPNIENVIHLVKLPLIPLEELLQIRKLGTLTGDKIFDAIEKQMTTKSTLRVDTKMLGQLPEENKNVAEQNVRTIQGEVKNSNEYKYQHTIGSSIIIELGQIFIINNLIIRVHEYNYSYSIEISTDQQEWERIIDYSSYICTSTQNLFFPSKSVKYVKIIGTCSVQRFFSVVKFEAYYRTHIPEIRNGIVLPKQKLTFDSSVWYENAEKVYFMLIYLKQPYYIDSIKFHIQGVNQNMKYMFYIEASLNERDWEIVADKRDEYVKDWQTFRFTPKPFSVIKITPTRLNISNRPLRPYAIIIENFECSSSV